MTILLKNNETSLLKQCAYLSWWAQAATLTFFRLATRESQSKAQVSGAILLFHISLQLQYLTTFFYHLKPYEQTDPVEIATNYILHGLGLFYLFVDFCLNRVPFPSPDVPLLALLITMVYASVMVASSALGSHVYVEWHSLQDWMYVPCLVCWVFCQLVWFLLRWLSTLKERAYKGENLVLAYFEFWDRFLS